MEDDATEVERPSVKSMWPKTAAGKMTLRDDFKPIPSYFAWGKVDAMNDIRQPSPVGSDTESLKRAAKQNLDALHKANRNLHAMQTKRESELSEAEKRRLLCKENIQRLQEQLTKPRTAIRSGKQTNAAEKHVHFDTSRDERYMTTADIKTTLESHLRDRIVRPPSRQKPRSRRIVRPRQRKAKHQGVRPLPSSHVVEAPPKPRSKPHLLKVKHAPSKKARIQPSTKTQWLRPAFRKLIFFKEKELHSNAKAMPTTPPPIPPLALAAASKSKRADLIRRHDALKRLVNPVYLHLRYPPYAPHRHYITEYKDKFRPPQEQRRPRLLMLT
ncbi:unnamed protein product [Aphanomyces euteiches]|uniref:Uncharacterized protein n=1 Tax=Aphanomyces euteiches TaxID=100861 RepID=A0A6G0XBK6_9STRA|nr:hypothetical protein Ae201684_006704 [Aphanomyces euteiches]KAH9091193.1 hypothetical protein Ae201684P_006593 [Aphanomyces euteiches]KAH9141081.1 hypothetical protein AeRB84_014711 [Aphanomyces euteiches]